MLGTYEPKRMVVCLDSALCNDGAEEHNVSVFRVTAVSGRQWCSVMKENVSDEMVWSDLANHTKERWQKVMELSSTTGSGLWEGRLWNSQIKLAQDNPVPSSPYQCCDWPNHLKPPYISETFFFLPHHFCFNGNWFSHPEDGGSAFLWDVGRFYHNAVQNPKRWPSSIKILQKCSCVAILILQVNVDPHYSYHVWCWRFEQLWLFRFGLFGWNTVHCGRHVPTCCLHLQCSLMMEAVGSSRTYGTCLLPHYMVSHPIKPLSQTIPCTKGILQCMHTSSNSYWRIWGDECLPTCRLQTKTYLCWKGECTDLDETQNAGCTLLYLVIFTEAHNLYWHTMRSKCMYGCSWIANCIYNYHNILNWNTSGSPIFLLIISLSTMKKPKDRKVNTVMKRTTNKNWRRYKAIWFSSLSCLSMSKHIWEWDLRLHQWKYNMIDGYWQATFLIKWRWGFQSSRMWHRVVGSHSHTDTAPYPRRLRS